MSETTGSMTPYAAAKTVNARLAAAGVAKTIPAQMMYNYTTAKVRAGKKPIIPVDADGRITAEALEGWLTKYLAKQTVAVEA
jgi:hypothetical protein